MGWVVNATPRPLYPRERLSTNCIGGWVGPRAGLDGCGKSRPPLGFDPQTVQPVASRYTDCAIYCVEWNLLLENLSLICELLSCLEQVVRKVWFVFTTSSVGCWPVG
jgi:hypothetical protein